MQPKGQLCGQSWNVCGFHHYEIRLKRKCKRRPKKNAVILTHGVPFLIILVHIDY